MIGHGAGSQGETLQVPTSSNPGQGPGFDSCLLAGDTEIIL